MAIVVLGFLYLFHILSSASSVGDLPVMVAAVVRTGDEYQAQIPELLSEEERQRIIHTAVAAPAPYRQLWGQPPADREDAEVAQFLTEFSRVSELEQVRNLESI